VGMAKKSRSILRKNQGRCLADIRSPVATCRNAGHAPNTQHVLRIAANTIRTHIAIMSHLCFTERAQRVDHSDQTYTRPPTRAVLAVQGVPLEVFCTVTIALHKSSEQRISLLHRTSTRCTAPLD